MPITPEALRRSAALATQPRTTGARTAPVHGTTPRGFRYLLGSLLAVALLTLALHTTPASASQAQGSVFQPTELTPVDEAERERAEKRRKVLLMYPAAVIGLVIVLVLTIKRKK